MKRILNPRVYIALGLVSLAASVLLASAALGLFPDREAAIRDGRMAHAEALAGGSIALDASEYDAVALMCFDSKWRKIAAFGDN